MNILFFLSPKMRLEYLHDTNSIRQALEKIRIKGYTAIPVVSKEDGSYVGTISEGDLLWHIIDNNYLNIKELENIKISEIINPYRYLPVKIDQEMKDLFNLITKQNFVPVVDDRNVFMGIITRKRVIEYLIEEGVENNVNE